MYAPTPEFDPRITSVHVCIFGTTRYTQNAKCVLSVSTHPRFWPVTILCAHDVRCVLNTSIHVQVTVTEKDSAFQEKGRAVQEKERAVREKEVAVQRLQVCSSHTGTHILLVVLSTHVIAHSNYWPDNYKRV